VLGNAEKQEVGRWANNLAENSHISFRQREQAMLRCRRMKTLQKFASVHANVHKPFRIGMPSRRSLHLQGTSLRRFGGVADACRLRSVHRSISSAKWGRVRIRLTASGSLARRDHELMIEAALAGIALAYVWEDRARLYVESGRLVSCLAEWIAPED